MRKTVMYKVESIHKDCNLVLYIRVLNRFDKSVTITYRTYDGIYTEFFKVKKLKTLWCKCHQILGTHTYGWEPWEEIDDPYRNIVLTPVKSMPRMDIPTL